jgi:pilus assembly protein Flp/PilA
MHIGNKILAAIGSFRNQIGVSMIEYGLLAALVAIAAVATISTLGTSLDAKFLEVSNELQ